MANMKNLWEHALKAGCVSCATPEFYFILHPAGIKFQEGEAPQIIHFTSVMIPMRSMEYNGARLTKWQAHTTRNKPLTTCLYTVDLLGKNFTLLQVETVTDCEIFGTLWQALDFLNVDLLLVKEKKEERLEKGTYEDRYVRLNAEYKHQTEKAFLLKVGDQEHWFPKSQVGTWFKVFFASRWILDKIGIPYKRIHAYRYET